MADKKQNSCGCGCMPSIKKNAKKGSTTPKHEDQKSKK